MTRYPLIEETVSVHAKLIARFGGSGGIRDRGALESALARPRSGYYSDVIQEAAALWESLSQNHPFVDGNKRLAVTMTGAFLRVNGYRLEFDDTEALSFLLDLYDALERLTEKTYSGSTTSKATLFYDTCDKGLGLLCGGAAYDPANTATVIGSFGYGYDD
ncbi:MAG: type II toxin-antitoxin system death-on-curing family toxin, partial [Bryobacteraceae bacterium]